MQWVKKAILLGVVFFVAVLLIKPIGVSTQFSVLSGIIYHAIDPDIIWENSDNEYGYDSSVLYYSKGDGKLASHIMNPWNYDFVFVLAIPLGGFLGARLYSKKNATHEVQKRKGKKRKIWNGYVKSFVAGFLLLYGARMADGCTSGHMMSGIMQGSISGYVFAASVFAIAIPTAIFLRLVHSRRQQDE